MPSLNNGRYVFDDGEWKNSPNGNWRFARDTQANKEVFVKEFGNWRYPPEGSDMTNPNVKKHYEKCKAFETRFRQVNAKINEIAGPSGTVVVATDVFHDEGNKIFKVNDKIDFKHWNAEEVCQHMAAADIDRMMRGLAVAIGTLHNANILHCDLKPENIFIVERSGFLMGLLSDFDDSFFLDAVPEPNSVVGTDGYLSPEISLYRSSTPEDPVDPSIITPSSDMFAIGLIYHQYLTGKMPVYMLQDEDTGEMYEVSAAEGALWGAKPQLAEDLDVPHRMVILKLLRAEPSDRLNTCMKLSQEINRFSSLERKKTCLTLKNGAAPIAGATVKLFVSYVSVSENTEYELIAEGKTDANGNFSLNTGLPDDSNYVVEYNGKYYKVNWTEDNSRTLRCELQFSTAKTIRLTRQGLKAAGVTTEAYQKVGGSLKKLFQGKSGASGDIVLPAGIKGECLLICDNYRYTCSFDRAPEVTIELKPPRSEEYGVIFRCAGQPAAKQPFELKVTAGGQQTTKKTAANDKGELILKNRPLFSNGQPVTWAVAVDGKDYTLDWYNQQMVTVDLPQTKTHAYIRVLDENNDPVQGTVAGIITLENGSARWAAQNVSNSNGLIDLGMVAEGDYYLIVSKTPADYQYARGLMKRARTPDFHVQLKPQGVCYNIRVKRSVLLDQRFDPPRGNIVRLVKLPDGRYELTSTTGSVSSVSKSMLRIYGLGEYADK